MTGKFETESLSLFLDSVGQILILPVAAPPGAGSGTPAPVGSIAVSNAGLVYQKIGSADTQWTVGAALGGTTSFTAFNNTPRGSNSTTYFDFLTLPANVVIPGLYKLSYSYVWSSNSTSTNIRVRILNQVNTILTTNIIEAKDSAGTGITVQRVDAGGTLDTGTTQRQPAAGFLILDLPAGLSTFRLQMSGSANNNRKAIYNVAMTLEKI